MTKLALLLLAFAAPAAAASVSGSGGHVRTRTTVVRVAALPDPGPRDPNPANDPPPQSTGADVLVDMIVELRRTPGIVNAIGDVAGCARSMGGQVGLIAGQGRAIVTCEYDEHGHPAGYQVYFSAADIAAYNAARGNNVQVVGEALGFGTGVPTGGMPSLNFTVITPADAAIAIERYNRLVDAERRTLPTKP